MNRDHLLFLTIGVLTGFIAGYVLHETMAERQAPRRPVPAALAGAESGSEGAAQATPGSMDGGPPARSAAPPMQEIQRLRERVEKNPTDAESILLLANLNFDIQGWQRARDLYERYLKLRPATPDVLTDLGVACRELGDFHPALELFNRAEAMAPEHWQSRYNKVVVLAFDLKNFPAADQALKELEKLQPGNHSVAELAAEVNRRRGAA